MAFDFYHNRIVWITGASSGIGRETALELARRNAHLILTSSSEEKLKKVQDDCLKNAASVNIITADLTKSESIPTLVKSVKNLHNRIDVAILNAGISQRGLFKDTSLEVHKNIFQINYLSNVEILKGILPVFIQQGWGHVAVTSSIVGKFGFPLRSAYSASKHALHGLMETLQIEHQNDNIFFTIAIPGRVKTDISVNALDAAGNKHGVLDQGQAQGISAQKCALQYLNAIEKKKREVLIGGKELMMVRIKRFFPSLFFGIAGRIKNT